MKIAVVGAGMAGVAAAYALASEGHLVAVFERHASVAEGASCAPTGIAAPALAAPWMPVPSWLQSKLSSAPDTSRLRELGADFSRRRLFSRAAHKASVAAAAKPSREDPYARRAAERARALYRLIRIGTKRIDLLAKVLALDFERSSGLLLTLSDAATLAQAEIAAEWLREAGEKVEWADAARQREIEPGLAETETHSRAIYLRAARIGNTREWTQLLRGHAEQLGATFRFQHEVVSLTAGPRPTLRFIAAKEPTVGAEGAARAPIGAMRGAAFDAVVVCTALDANRLLTPLGVKLPWRPLRGYSLTVPLNLSESTTAVGPRAAMIDVKSGIAITRLGARVRVASGYEPEVLARKTSPFAPAAAAPSPQAKTVQPLYDALGNCFPGTVHWLQAQLWQAARPALADGLPAVGPCGVPDIWLSVGHGHHGWPLSLTAADALCAMMAGRATAFNASPMAVQRFRSNRA